jgi:putative membrane protein
MHAVSTLTSLVLAAALAVGAPAYAADDDAEFVKEAASSSHLEVELGNHAAEHASSPAVRAFGRRMAEDHGKAAKELEDLARSQGLSYPTAASEDHQEEINKLMKLSGSEFDRKYMELMVEEHEEDLEELREQADGDSQVARWAARTAPTIEAHLAEARRVQEQLESRGESGSAKERESSMDR